MTVDISTLVPDPVNARLHPDRNLAAIKDSLALYGQLKPIVVRKASRVVAAGNGTMEAAKALGWTKIAANIVDIDETAAAGFGLADNRTAELAKWDFAVVAQLDALLQKAGVDPVGWSKDELDVLRMADWTPPTITEGGFGGEGEAGEKPLVLGFNPDQYQHIDKAVVMMRERLGKTPEELTTEDTVRMICEEWMGNQGD